MSTPTVPAQLVVRGFPARSSSPEATTPRSPARRVGEAGLVEQGLADRAFGGLAQAAYGFGGVQPAAAEGRR